MLVPTLLVLVTSFFHWLGKIERAEECLIVMKSRDDLFEQVADHVKGLHSYEVPEVLAVPIVEGSKAYLDWMSMVLKPLMYIFVLISLK